MLQKISAYYQEFPFRFVLIAGAIIRLVAVLFSKGYGMHDDHFLIIEAAQSWVDGFDYNNWLPQNSVEGKPTGHSFFYVGLHYILFRLTDLIGWIDPQSKMFLVRLIHAAYSILIVSLGYKITEHISNEKMAAKVGLLLALLWFFPILSVRNLVELVCIPPLMYATWILMKSKDDFSIKTFLLAGFVCGFAVAIRIQSVLFVGGIGLVLLIWRQWTGAVVFGLSAFFAIFLSQVTDLFTWGYVFAEYREYIEYNILHSESYFTQPWYNYILLIFGVLIPPISLFLIFGYMRSWKKQLILFLPAFIFVVFHSYFPNKQERFILPAIPFIIILGITGWNEFVNRSAFWKNKMNWINGSWKFFWGLNTLLLLIFSVTYSKRSRVEAMNYLYEQSDFRGMIVERSHRDDCYLMPRYYLNNWDAPIYCINESYTDDSLPEIVDKWQQKSKANYLLIVEEKDLAKRKERILQHIPQATLATIVDPSFMDKVLHWLNPYNQNERVYIYKIQP